MFRVSKDPRFSSMLAPDCDTGAISSISTSSYPLPLAFHNDASGFLRCLYGEISRKGPDLGMTKTCFPSIRPDQRTKSRSETHWQGSQSTPKNGICCWSHVERNRRTSY